MIEKKISVIVPMYNSQEYIEKCIQSLSDQSYQNLEIIVINDGSTDNSLAIVENLIEQDQRIKLFTQKNKGVSAARNHGLDKATGDFIGFVDSDDFIDRDMYKDMLTELVNSNSDIAECGYKKINNGVINSFYLEEEIIESKEKIIEHYLLGTNTTNYNCNKLYKKKLVENIRYELLSYSEDYLFNVMTHSAANKKIIIQQDFYNYVNNINSAVNAPFNKRRLDQIKSGKIAYNNLKDSNFNSNILSHAISYNIEQIIDLFKKFVNDQEFEKSKLYLLRVFRKHFKLLIKNGNFYSVYDKKQLISRIIFFINPNLYLKIIEKI